MIHPDIKLDNGGYLAVTFKCTQSSEIIRRKWLLLLKRDPCPLIHTTMAPIVFTLGNELFITFVELHSFIGQAKREIPTTFGRFSPGETP